MNKKIVVWDLPTRLFHWCLVSAVFYSWFSIEILEDIEQHFYSGYVVLQLLLFRLVWGVVGSHYSRFASFYYSPRYTLRYLKSLWSPNAEQYLGHNPLGSLSAALMIIVLLSQAMMGLFSSDDYYFGPLSGLVDNEIVTLLSELHLLNSNMVYGVISLHIVAILYYALRKKDALTKAMITGEKRVTDDIDYADLESSNKLPASKLLALIIFLCCAVFVYYLATAFLDRLPSPLESYY